MINGVGCGEAGTTVGVDVPGRVDQSGGALGADQLIRSDRQNAARSKLMTIKIRPGARRSISLRYL